MNEKVKKMLIEFNPFWKKPFEINYKNRAIYPEIKRLIKEPQIITLCGLRRVGKTTILNKIIYDLLKKHKSDEIVYFSFDDFQGCEVLDVINGATEINGKEPKFLVFDEVQKIQNWAEKIKIIYDTKKCKIFVSGSESLFLLKGSRESLAGRIYEFEVEGLTFSEYLNFIGKEKMKAKPLLYEKELKEELKNYLITAGFPELIGKKDEALVKRYIRSSIIEKIVFRDMIVIYPIEDPQKIISILEILIDNPGMLVDFTSFSQELGISRQTISKYFEYLELSHLVIKLFNFSKNKSTSEKRLKKFYPTFLSPVLSYKKEEDYYSKIIETFCVLNTKAEFFWRDKYKNELDLVLKLKNDLLPVEIKYRKQPTLNKGMEKFCKKYSCKKALIITKDTRRKEQTFTNLQWTPVFEFLLSK